MNTNNAGGGEVLQYIGNNNNRQVNLDEALMQQLEMLPWIKLLIVILLVFVAGYVIMQLFGIRSVFKGKGLSGQLSHMDSVKKHDDQIRRANNFISTITAIIEKTPFHMPNLSKEYMEYNLTRANVRIPGGYRVMRPAEFNALKVCGKLAFIVVGILIGIFWSLPIGVVLAIASFYLIDTFSDMTIRSTVAAKDREVTENFSDFYLMIHYVLLSRANIPLTGIIKSYDKTTSSDEMHRFVDCCIHYIDTYNEYEATKYIASAYREIPYVGKLMRLIRQVNEGAEVEAELMGFRQELLNAKRYAIEQRGDRMIMRARASMNLLYIVLVQAVISAMMIYIDDLSLTSSIL